MKGFDDIKLEWQDKTYTVPADRQMELILRVEEGITRGKGGQAALVLSHEQGPPVARSCQVFADVLRYAGADVSDLEVFHAVHENIRGGDGALIVYIQERFMLILGLIDLSDLRTETEETTPRPKTKPPTKA